eukprot:c16307_g1_i1 orf=1-348(-)
MNCSLILCLYGIALQGSNGLHIPFFFNTKQTKNKNLLTHHNLVRRFKRYKIDMTISWLKSTLTQQRERTKPPYKALASILSGLHDQLNTTTQLSYLSPSKSPPLTPQLHRAPPPKP